MAKLGFLLVACLFVLSSFEVDALKCWRCSSDASSAAFCDDPFDPSLITEKQKQWSYVDCSTPPPNSNPYSANSRPVCKKLKQTVNGKITVSRACFWEDISAPHDQCLNAPTPAYIKNEFCETCTTDGCNGASQFGAAALLVGATALICKLLAF